LNKWQALFEDLSNEVYPDWLDQLKPGTVAETPTPGILELSSPRLVVGMANVLYSVPTLSFEDDSVGPDPFDLEQAATWIREFKPRFSSLKPEWGQAFMDVEANHVLLVKDLQALHSTVSALTTQVGSLPTGDFVGFGSTLWSTLRNMARTLTDHTTTLASTASAIQDLRQASIEAAEEHETAKTQDQGRFQTIEKCLQVYESRFSKILPILRSAKRAVQGNAMNSVPRADYEVLQKQVAQLTATVESMQTVL